MGYLNRAALLHPGWLTALVGVWIFGGPWLAGTLPVQMLLALPSVLSLVPLVWMLALYRAAGLSIRDVVASSAGYDWIFWLAGAANLATAAVLMVEGDAIIAAMRLPAVIFLPVSVSIVCWIVATGLAAFNLSAFDRGAVPTAQATARVFALLWTWPIGAWILQPIVRRLRHGPPAGPTGPVVQG